LKPIRREIEELKAIKTDIDIQAPAETVWEMLSDTDAFPSWNPFITRLEGFTGILVPLMASALVRTAEGFTEMNQALKMRAQAANRGPEPKS
jgi:hypothetical protein